MRVFKLCTKVRPRSRSTKGKIGVKLERKEIKILLCAPAAIGVNLFVRENFQRGSAKRQLSISSRRRSKSLVYITLCHCVNITRFEQFRSFFFLAR